MSTNPTTDADIFLVEEGHVPTLGERIQMQRAMDRIGREMREEKLEKEKLEKVKLEKVKEELTERKTNMATTEVLDLPEISQAEMTVNPEHEDKLTEQERDFIAKQAQELKEGLYGLSDSDKELAHRHLQEFVNQVKSETETKEDKLTDRERDLIAKQLREGLRGLSDTDKELAHHHLQELVDQVKPETMEKHDLRDHSHRFKESARETRVKMQERKELAVKSTLEMLDVLGKAVDESNKTHEQTIQQLKEKHQAELDQQKKQFESLVEFNNRLFVERTNILKAREQDLETAMKRLEEQLNYLKDQLAKKDKLVDMLVDKVTKM